MPTANDLIKSAAIKLGAIQTGETLSADEVSDSLAILNSWLDSESTVKGMIYHIQQESFTWNANQASQTIGTGGDFNTTRPIHIEDGTYFRDVNTIDDPITILRDRQSYDSLASKTDTTTFPEILYYEPDYPLGVLYVYPVPSQNITFKLNSWKALQVFALTDNLAMPPGYQWMIENNLAVHLEPVFSVPCPERVKREAIDSKKRVKRINHVPLTSFNDAFHAIRGRGKSDIQVGE